MGGGMGRGGPQEDRAVGASKEEEEEEEEVEGTEEEDGDEGRRRVSADEQVEGMWSAIARGRGVGRECSHASEHSTGTMFVNWRMGEFGSAVSFFGWLPFFVRCFFTLGTGAAGWDAGSASAGDAALPFLFLRVLPPMSRCRCRSIGTCQGGLAY
eukprot:10079247-Alexandrium_andersonii.AAC.1